MIKVLLFADLQEAMNTNQLTLQLENLTVSELKEHLHKNEHLPMERVAFVAVNEEYATDNNVIKSGDVVALIPPVSGG